MTKEEEELLQQLNEEFKRDQGGEELPDDDGTTMQVFMLPRLPKR